MKTTYLGLELRSPVIVASSPYTASARSVAQCAAAGAGAVVLKSLFEEQVVRHAAALDCASAGAGMGDAGEYLERYLGDAYRAEWLRLVADARATGIPVIASINCFASAGAWIDYACALVDAGASACCPPTAAAPRPRSRPPMPTSCAASPGRCRCPCRSSCPGA